MRNGFGCGLAAVAAVVSVVALIRLVYVNWHIDRDINGWKTRAQVSSEPNDMFEYMTHVREGMEKWEMTEGYADVIFPTPNNDMSLIYRAVGQHIDQAEVLTHMDRSSPEYQTGLDNLRGSIRELNLYTNQYWGWHQGLWIWIVLLVTGVLACVGMVMAVEL